MKTLLHFFSFGGMLVVALSFLTNLNAGDGCSDNGCSMGIRIGARYCSGPDRCLCDLEAFKCKYEPIVTEP
jgi:hypothetical protein